MTSTAAKGFFLLGLSILGAVMVLGIYQVPQPWRGWLVAWLLFVATAGVFILRVIRHLYEFKSLTLERRQAALNRAEDRPRDRNRRPEPLRVVRTQSAGAGRHVVR